MQCTTTLQERKPTHNNGAGCNAIACSDKIFPYTEMFVYTYVDFAGGCTGAAGQVSHCVTRARSFASGSFPQPRGAPHWDLLIKLHICQITPNPSKSSLFASLYSFLWLWRQQVTSCDKLTTLQKHREQWRSLTLFVSHTVKYAHTNGQIAWKCVSVRGAKMVLSLFFSRAGRDWWQEDYWSSRRWN